MPVAILAINEPSFQQLGQGWPFPRSLHARLIDRLREFDWTYELCLAENGSTDRTVAVGEELAARFPQVSIRSVGAPNYGLALRRGIIGARGEFVICDEIDLCDSDFHRRAIDLLRTDAFDMVIGSKLLAGAQDERPFVRHAASLVYNGILRAAVEREVQGA